MHIETEADDAHLYRAADLLIRKHGGERAMVHALARRDDLLKAGQIATAELWTRLAQILAVLIPATFLSFP